MKKDERGADGVARGKGFLRRMFSNRAAVLGCVFVGVLIVCALFPNQLAPQPPNKIRARDALSPPNAEYPLGTDRLGRDQLSRIIHGARISLIVGTASMAIAASIGVALGIIAGYVGGVWSTVIMRSMDALRAFPTLVLAIFLVTLLGTSMFNAVFALGIVYMPAFARIARASALSIREDVFVTAARSIGASDLRIMTRHILPNSVSPIIVNVTLGVSRAILAESSLSFLGLGVQRPTASWGTMVAEGRSLITSAPWMITFPGLAIFLAVLGFNFVGDGLREALDPRLRGVI